MKSIFELYNKYKQLDVFLKDQLLIGLINTLVWTLSVPIIHKLQGLYWSTAYISFSLLLYMGTGMFLSLFKNVSLKRLYLTLMFFNFLYALSMIIYFYDISTFLYVEVILGLGYSIYGPLLGISWELYVIKNYSPEVFENFRYAERFRDSLGGVLGYGIVGLTSALFKMKTVVYIFIIMMVFMIAAQQINWFKHYRKMS